MLHLRIQNRYLIDLIYSTTHCKYYRYLSNKLMWTKNVFGYSKNYYNETLHAYNLNPISAAVLNHRYSSRDSY